MPVTRRRSMRRRSTRARTKKQQVTYRVPRGVRGYAQPFQIAKLRYAIYDGDSHDLASTSGSIAGVVYRANDLFDPYQTGVGSQPRGFDQIMAQFRNFIVLGSKITCDFTFGSGSSTSTTAMCAVTLRDGTVAMSTTKDIMEHPRTRFKVISAESDRVRVINKYSWRWVGASDPLDNENLYGTTSSSPTEGLYYHINAYCPSSGTENIWVSGFIDYTAIFFHRINPTAS